MSRIVEKSSNKLVHYFPYIYQQKILGTIKHLGSKPSIKVATSSTIEYILISQCMVAIFKFLLHKFIVNYISLLPTTHTLLMQQSLLFKSYGKKSAS